MGTQVVQSPGPTALSVGAHECCSISGWSMLILCSFLRFGLKSRKTDRGGGRLMTYHRLLLFNIFFPILILIIFMHKFILVFI